MALMLLSELGSSQEAHGSTKKVQLVVEVVIICIAGVTLAMLQCHCVRTRVSVLTLEIALSFTCCIFMCLTVLTQPLYLSKMLNHNLLHDCTASDSVTLIIIDGIVTAAHLGLAIRWKVAVSTEVVGISLYAFIVFALGSVDNSASFNLAGLVGLVMVTSVGKRSSEIMERRAFLDILGERTLRCQAEFQLSSGNVGSENRPTRPESIPESLPTSTATGQVFDSFCTEGADLKEALQKVELMGIQEHWCIDAQQVKLLPGQILGSGCFGIVVKGIFCGMQVAVKMPQSALQDTDVPALSDMSNELRVVRRLRHQNICAMQGAIIDVQHLRVALVLEMVQGMQLDSFIEMTPQCSSPKMPEAMARYQLILGICSALVYLHTRNPCVVHGDLKPSNILVESSGDAVCPRLVDFGLSCVLTRGSKPLGGTPQWMPPEVLIRSSPKQCSTDIYSFGHLVAFVATGTMPMSGLNYAQMIKCLRRRKPSMPFWPDACPFKHTFMPLVTRCLDVNAASRPSAQEAHLEILQQLDSLHLEGDIALFLQEHLIAEAWDQGIADRILAPTPDTSDSRLTPIHTEAHPADASNVVVPLATESPEAAPAASAAQTSAAPLPSSRLAL